ncbi:MAG: hypothetical protein HQL48_07270, partial [Gammaproteobacteria bacterium]|nr:hypothetical protein [Gammaproteobacteria bacterium]
TPYTSPVVTPPLSQSLPTRQGDGSPVGVTARLVRDVFFEQQDSASFWIQVAVEGAVIPEEGSDPGKVLRLEIHDVLTTTQQQLYDPQQSFEDIPFQFVNMQWQRDDGGQKRLEGIRSVTLPGTPQEASIATIHGTAYLSYPSGVSSLTITSQEIATPFDLYGLQLTVHSIEGREIALEVKGEGIKERLLTTSGITAAGEEVSWSGRGSNHFGGSTRINLSFNEEVRALKLFVAEEIVNRATPFTLSSKTPLQLSF